MRREGRQHGLVRTRMILPPPYNSSPKSRVVNQLESPPTAGMYTKVPSKPTNHSKFTGKCSTPTCMACHLRPSCKAKSKAKGAHKLRSSHLITGGVDSAVRLSSTGAPASGVLFQIAGDYWADAVDEDVEDVSEDESIQAWLGQSTGASGSELGSPRRRENDEDDGWFLVGEDVSVN